MTNEEQMMISNLKGRISKILSYKNQLLVAEKNTLEDIYNALDKFIISDKKAANVKALKGVLARDNVLLEGTNKEYIQNHILPLLTKLSEATWGKKGRKKHE